MQLLKNLKMSFLIQSQNYNQNPISGGSFLDSKITPPLLYTCIYFTLYCIMYSTYISTVQYTVFLYLLYCFIRYNPPTVQCTVFFDLLYSMLQAKFQYLLYSKLYIYCIVISTVLYTVYSYLLYSTLYTHIYHISTIQYTEYYTYYLLLVSTVLYAVYSTLFFPPNLFYNVQQF